MPPKRKKTANLKQPADPQGKFIKPISTACSDVYFFV